MEYYVQMSFRQWLALLMLFVMYILLGTSIFYTIEHNLETERRAVALQERIKIHELLVNYTSPDDIEIQNMVLDEVSDYCGRKVTNHTLDEYVPPYVWNVFHAFYFSFTTCTTVGYGNISPSDSLGRIILCFYSLFGIPISCFFIATIAHFFADTYIKLYRQYNEYKHATNKNYVPPAVGFVGKICLYMSPGIIIFIFLPAILFAHFEDWDYVKAVYFSYVTLSTVGYGDLVATFQSHQEREFGTPFYLYEAFIIIWNLAGLGYVLMIINFIAKGMKSKRVGELEHKISQNIRATEHLIRQEVSKDLNFLRRLLNEINLMKVKPVYTDTTSSKPYQTLVRSPSCPQLVMYHPKRMDHDLRCRSYSVSTSQPPSKMGTPTLNKAQSDSDLNRIDRRKTFGNSSNKFGSDDLITKVVSALGSIQQYDEDERSLEFGMNGLSDSQILSSERRSSGWSLPPFNLPVSRVGSLISSNQNIWDGNNLNENRASQMLDITKDKKLNSSLPSYSRSVSLNIPEDDRSDQIINVYDKMVNKSSSPVSRIMSDKGKRNSITLPEVNLQMNLDRTKVGRASIISLPRQYISATSRGRDSVLSILDAPINATNSEFLEKTSIADLIRALEVVHTTSSQKEIEYAPTNLKNCLNQNANSRRGSLRPIPGYTTVFSSSDSMNPIRKISSLSNPDSSLLSRHSSLRPRHPPPQYTETVTRNPLRFNVRPTNTSQERGNSSLLIQKKLPLGPSPLARNEMAQDSTKQAGARKRITELIRM